LIVELVSTGTELLLGQIVNTNAAYLARKLNELGFNVYYQSTVGDNRERMAKVLASALERADIVITTGGLGPTQGDITKEVTAQVLGRKMYLHEDSLKTIKCFFANRGLEMTENNARQAFMPEGAIVVANYRGTAPGVIIEIPGPPPKTVINLPGPPHELEHMFETSIIPYLNRRFGSQGVIVSTVLRTIGLGESSLEDRIKHLVKAQSNPTLALLARGGEIHVRITAKAQTREEALRLIEPLRNELWGYIGQFVFGTDEDTLESVVGALLTKNNLTLAVAESCTGGMISKLLTDVPGSSSYFIGSAVCYSNRLKTMLAGVPEEIIAEHGAVSPETASAMAKGIRKSTGADIGLGITGIAGPGGGTPDKPVGLVYIAVDGSHGTIVKKNIFAGQRDGIRQRSSLTALNEIRKYVLQPE